jgi:RND family efflux transporter MFP subunit
MKSASWFTLLAATGLVSGLVAVAPGCSTSPSSAAEWPSRDDAEPIAIATTRPVQQPIVRTLRVTGTLVADEQAEVSAETIGRVIATPVERGSRVTAGAVLVQLATEEAQAQLAEAEANAARIAAGLALGKAGAFDVDRVPDVANAGAELALAQAEYERIRALLDQKVVSQSEYDQRRTRVEAARQRYESERNKARQEFRSWEASRARVLLARKGVRDATLRAPFAGLVAERLVSTGDFVGVGTPVASVVRIDPLRVVLTIPEQFVAHVQQGQQVTFGVDAYPGRRFEGSVRFISPALREDQRALTVEAVVANPEGLLKPGLFATADLARPAELALLVDRRAIRAVGATSRVFVVNGETLEERIVTIGQPAGALVEVVAGLSPDAIVALPGSTPLSEGLRVHATASVAASRAPTPVTE